MYLPKEISFALERLNASGYEAFVVGGAVRDSLMQREVSDYDIASSATPDDIKRVFGDHRLIETGISHGTVTVVIGERSVEITAFRTESGYTDGRHPDAVSFSTSLYEDLGRRDLTVNAIAYNKKTGYIDPYGGISDISQKTVRCLPDPEKRLTEDRLRILRCLRFASVLGFSVEEETKKAILKLCGGVATVSAERIFSELCKLICGENVKSVLTDFTPVITAVIPELMQYSLASRLKHTSDAVSYVDPLPHLRFAMLFHEICKDSKEERAEAAERVLRRLHAQNSLIQSVRTLIEALGLELRYDDTPKLRRLIGKHGIDTVSDIVRVKRADVLADDPKAYYRLESLHKLSDAVYRLGEEKGVFTVKDLKINGKDLIAAGVPEGRELGRLLSLALEDVINEECENEKFVLLAHIKNKYGF